MAVTPQDSDTIDLLAGELRNVARIPFSEVAFLPRQPGLYAIWAETLEAKALLGLNDHGFGLPLYVGLARQPLPGRVGQYVEPSDDYYVPARFWIEYQLLVASHVTVPEAVLLGAPQLWSDQPMPFHEEHLDALTSWMKANLSVSVAPMQSKKEAQRLEHSVIRRMEPIANKQGMAWALDVADYYKSRYTAEAYDRRILWIGASAALAALAPVFNFANRPEAIKASERKMYFRFDAEGLPEAIVYRRCPYTNPTHLRLPLHPDERAEACRGAMECWYGEVYPETDRLLAELGEEDWVPGVLFHLLVGEDRSLADPLVQLSVP